MSKENGSDWRNNTFESHQNVNGIGMTDNSGYSETWQLVACSPLCSTPSSLTFWS